MVVVRVRDRSGNVGTAPAVLPPVPGQVRGKPGITVRQITAQPPVRAGARGRARRSSSSTRAARPYRWSVRRIGASRPIKKGRGAPGKTLSLRAPRGISGAYLLELRSGRYRASVPFLVQSPERAKLLVVVPDASRGSGVDKVDDDGDGLPNTLETGGPVRVAARDQRATTGIPPAFAAETAPLLVFLDRARIRYDLTSRHRARPLPRPARAPTARASCSPARCAGSRARWRAGCAATSRTAGGWRASAPSRCAAACASATNRPHAADPADADRPVRRAPRAGRGPAHRGRRPHAAAAHRARRGPRARPADRLRRRRSTRSAGSRSPPPRPETRARQGADRARPGRLRRRARQGRGQGRAAARGAAGADRDAARQGRRDPRRADRSGRSGRARTARSRRSRATSSTSCAASRRGCARRAGEDPQLRHPQRQRSRAARSGRQRAARARSARAAASSTASSSLLRRARTRARRAGGGRAARRRGRTGAGAGSPPPPGVPGSFMRLAWPIAARGRDGRRHARQRQPRRIDRDDPLRAQQLAHRLLEMEALEPLGQQQDEERLVHRCRTL